MRLGFEGIQLIINADDLLLSRSVDQAVVALLDEGAISNTTALMCLPQSAQSLLELSSRIDTRRIGLHLQLTSGKPLLHDVPSLIDCRTQLFASKDNLKNTLAEEVEREWRSQISLFRSVVGHTPSHLDSHHGPHRLAHLLPVYLKLAKELGVPVRGGNQSLSEQISSFGVKTTTICLGDWTGKNLSPNTLMDKVLGYYSSKHSVTLEIVTHPAFLDPYLREISSLNDARFNDFSALRSFRKLVTDEPRVAINFYQATR